MRPLQRASTPSRSSSACFSTASRGQVLREGIHELVVGNCRGDVHLGPRAFDHRANQRLEPVSRVVQGRTVIRGERVEQGIDPCAAERQFVVLGDDPEPLDAVQHDIGSRRPRAARRV